MIYLYIVIVVILLAFLFLIWLRKVQYDAVHRNFLDLVDHYGGNVSRSGFAVRPGFAGTFQGSPLSILISSEKKNRKKPRQFYISLYFKSPANYNFTVLSNNWLELRGEAKKKQRPAKLILNKKYRLEAVDKSLLEALNIAQIEKIIRKMDPIAYVLVSKKGLILETISTNVIKDTEFAKISQLIEGAGQLVALSAG